MAIRFDFLNENKRNVKRVKANRPEKTEQPVTAEDVHNIVAQKVQAASTMNQMMHYFDDIIANNVKCETMISELREEVDRGFDKIDAISVPDNTERFDSLDKSVENLLVALHKDNLIMYKNLKEIVEENRQTQETLVRKTRRLSIAVMWLSILSLGGIATALLKIFEVF